MNRILAFKNRLNDLYTAITSGDLPSAMIITLTILGTVFNLIGLDVVGPVALFIITWFMTIVTQWHYAHIARFKTRTSLLKVEKV